MSDSITFDGETPRNTAFGDTYFSKADGQAETRHVFLGANGLPDRWQDHEGKFTIGELGFGTGLNFFESVRLWNEIGAPCDLDFISFEAFPMSPEDLVKSLEPWSAFDEAAKWLSDQWPLAEGWHELKWQGATLHLGMGDARELIKDVISPIHAWFLDGFAPSRNPELWEQDLLNRVYEHTAPEGSFATYTSAGFVRRNLRAAGFEVEKFEGFGTKREMMRGHKS